MEFPAHSTQCAKQAAPGMTPSIACVLKVAEVVRSGGRKLISDVLRRAGGMRQRRHGVGESEATQNARGNATL